MRVTQSVVDGKHRAVMTVSFQLTREEMALALAMFPGYRPGTPPRTKADGLLMVRLALRANSAAVYEDRWGVTAPTPVTTTTDADKATLGHLQGRYAAALAVVDSWHLYPKHRAHPRKDHP